MEKVTFEPGYNPSRTVLRITSALTFSHCIVLYCVVFYWQVSDAKDLCDMAHDDATTAFEVAARAKNQSERVRVELDELILAITEFLEQHGARPEDIRTVCVSPNTIDTTTPVPPTLVVIVIIIILFARVQAVV